MKNGINVLSLFDGISCGRVALERIGIKVENYYSSEIDKNAIKIANKNYPQDKENRLGDVTKWKEWDIPKIDLLIGGSPCQGFSFAGKQLNFEDIRSKLFFEYVDILKYYKPKYFLLENVKMKKEYQDIISNYLGVEPIEINSLLVSAQSRKRLYWTNIPNINQPKNKKIYLKDVLGLNTNKKLEDKIIMEKIITKVKIRKKEVNIEKLKQCLREHKNKSCNQLAYELQIPKTKIEHWFRKDKSFAIPDENIWFDLKKILNIKTNEFDESITEFKIRNSSYDSANRSYRINGKSPTLTTITGGKQRKKILDDNNETFFLTPIHYERLQTLPDNYTEGITDNQRYKCLGNGWTVDVIAHILSFANFN